MSALTSHELNTAGNCRTCGTSYPCEVVARAEFTMQWDESTSFPFVEDENANITAYGHQDKAAFAAEVNRYDEVCNGEPFPDFEQWGAEHIGHRWAVFNRDGESITAVEPGTPGAFPITTLWGQR